MPEKEYKKVCAYCDIPIETKDIRVLRFTSADMVEWRKIERGMDYIGRFFTRGLLVGLLIVLVLIHLVLPIFLLPSLISQDYKIENPFYPEFRNYTESAAKFFLQDSFKSNERRGIVFIMTIGGAYCLLFVIYDFRRRRKYAKRKKELFAKHDFNAESDEEYVVEEAKSN
jgi:hypothetical protein